MYEAFYHFNANPFRLTPDPNFCFRHRSHNQAWSYLLYAVKEGEGFIVVTGRPGTGKTTLIQTFLNELKQNEVVATRIAITNVEAVDLLRETAYSYGINAEGLDKATLLQRIEQFLARQNKYGKRVLLFIDEAQGLPRAALEELRLLADLQIGSHPLIQVFLIGQEKLRNLMREPNMEQFQQRVIGTCHLQPLDLWQTRAYMEHRLYQVNWRGDPQLTGPAILSIYQYSQGVPRHINKVASRLLLYGFLENKHELNEEDVFTVAEELREKQLAPMESGQTALDHAQGEVLMPDFEDGSLPVAELALRAPLPREEPAAVIPAGPDKAQRAADSLARSGNAYRSPPRRGSTAPAAQARQGFNTRFVQRQSRSAALWWTRLRSVTADRVKLPANVRLPQWAWPASITGFLHHRERSPQRLNGWLKWLRESPLSAGALVLITVFTATLIVHQEGYITDNNHRHREAIKLAEPAPAHNASATRRVAADPEPDGLTPATPFDSTLQASGYSRQQSRDKRYESTRYTSKSGTEAGLIATPSYSAGTQPGLESGAPGATASIGAARVSGAASETDARQDRTGETIAAIQGTETAFAQPRDTPDANLNTLETGPRPAHQQMLTAAVTPVSMAGPEQDTEAEPITVDPGNPIPVTTATAGTDSDTRSLDPEAAQPRAATASAAMGEVAAFEPVTVAVVSDQQGQRDLVKQKTTVPSLSRHGQVTRLLSLGRQSRREDRLLIPARNNAIHYYQKVLRLDPGNREALDGIDKVVGRYATLARRAIVRQDSVKASRYIARGLRIEPADRRLLALQDIMEAPPVKTDFRIRPPPLEFQDTQPSAEPVTEPTPAAEGLLSWLKAFFSQSRAGPVMNRDWEDEDNNW